MKRALCVCLAGLLLLALVACGASRQQAAVETVSFTDSCGRTVEIPRHITRIAPSGVVAQMILYTLAPEKLVGWSSLPNSAQLRYIPSEYLDLPTFGQFYGSKANLNMESIVAADAQIIIDLGDMREDHAADMDAVQKKCNIPTIFLETSLTNIADAYRTLGVLLECEDKANEIADYIDAVVTDAETRAALIPEDARKTVLYGSGQTGLNCNARGSVQADVIELVGGVNAVVVEAISNKGGGNTISMEQLYVFDPDVILLTADGPYDTLTTDPRWASLRAVQADAYYQIPQLPYCWMSNPPSVNRIIGIRWLGNLLYPDVFDYDMDAEVKRFYALFWNYTLSDEEVAAFLQNSTNKANGTAKE